jgi:RNA-directed DNA polymerase
LVNFKVRRNRKIKTKPFNIPKQIVYESWLKVKTNKGSAGIDGETVEEYEADLKKNLFKLWNKMSSGSYFPPAVKLVEIPKKNGGIRPLGIPTVNDRIAQTVCKTYLEPVLNRIFHKNSYGYRPGRSAISAVGKCRERCWQYNWVIDLDIKGFFDNIRHDLLMKAVKFHTNRKWIILYIERWLTVDVVKPDGEVEKRTKGTPQGGVISPLLANLFLHYTFDKWMERKFPRVEFERYADDIIVHCCTESQAQFIKYMIEKRMGACGLKLHPEKTKIVYCKDGRRPIEYANTEFTFLGYTFKVRTRRSKDGKRILYTFLPAVSDKDRKRMKDIIRDWQIRKWVDIKLTDVAEQLNRVLRGWVNYYGCFYRSALREIFKMLNNHLVKWAKNKYKSLKRKWSKAREWLQKVFENNQNMFVHWSLGMKP